MGGAQHLSRPTRRDPSGWEGSHASFWLGVEFHFQPLLDGSHGSLQTFDNEAKYTLESEEAWAPLPERVGAAHQAPRGIPAQARLYKRGF